MWHGAAGITISLYIGLDTLSLTIKYLRVIISFKIKDGPSKGGAASRLKWLHNLLGTDRELNNRWGLCRCVTAVCGDRCVWDYRWGA